MICRSLCLVLALVLAAAPSARAAGPGGKRGPGFDITFRLYYRASVSHAHTAEKVFTLSGAGEQITEKTVQIGEFAVRALLSDSAYDARSIHITVATKAGRTISSQLYQLRDHGLPENDFTGGHGFSGLNYVYHPTSPGELQFMLQVADPSRGR